jgi:hypothetical protein
MRNQGSIPGRRTGCSPLHSVQTSFWANVASYPKGAGGTVLGGKAAETWSWQSPPFSIMVKNIRGCISTPQYVFTEWHVMKQRNNFTFTFTINIKYSYLRWNSAVGIATSYGLDGRRAKVRVPVGSITFSPPRRPDWLWGPFSLLSTGYRGSFPERKVARAWNWLFTSK